MCGLKRRLNYPEFINYIEKHDFVCVTETNTDSSDIVDLNGFTYFSKHRTQHYLRKSGGIGVYVRTSIAKHVEVISNDSEYALWLTIHKTLTEFPENMILGAIYLPPENSRFLNDDDLNSLENEISEMANNHKYIMLAGDFNARTSSLSDFIPADNFINEMYGIDEEEQAHLNKYTILEKFSSKLERNSKDKKTKSHGMFLIDLCRNNNLFILNGRMDNDSGNLTFRDKSVLDYVIATADCFEFIHSFTIVETDPLFSDEHNALHWVLRTCDHDLENNETLSTEARTCWKHSLSDRFCSNLDRSKLHDIESNISMNNQTQENIDQITQKLQDIFQEAENLNFEKRSSKQFATYPQNKPWFGPKCHQARRNYHDAKQSYEKEKNDTNKLKLKHASTQYKRTMNYFINEYKHKQADKLRNINTNNPKQYWKYINSLKHKPKINATPTLNNFYGHFKQINSDENHVTHELNEPIKLSNNETLDQEISVEEISKCINNLKNDKTPSPSDKIRNEHIKSSKHLFINVYYKLFNAVLNTGTIPQKWLEGYIVPIFKNKGESVEACNYRPITILSCLGKLFTSILNHRLTQFLETNDILNENQAGFRKHYSCSDHIFTLYALINILKKEKHTLYCAFIDFSQAFDKVWRFGLWQKVLKVTDGKLFRVIFNMYQNIKSCVKHQGQLSDFFRSENGVRQGENLSPILFSLFLNDLQQHLGSDGVRGIELNDQIDETLWLKLLVMLYADDTIIVSDDERDFQICLNSFQNYCNNWNLSVNVKKTKVIVFGSRNNANFNFTLGANKLEIVDTYHYLGVTF